MEVKRKKIVRSSRKPFVISQKQIEVEYDKDFYRWTKNQSKFLKNKDYSHLDFKNLIEEIKSLGISDKRSLKSHAVVLLTHLLKQKYQKEKESKSWRNSISNAKLQIRFILEDSPSLKRLLNKIFSDAYIISREKASEETGIDLNKFPKECPWTIEEALS